MKRRFKNEKYNDLANIAHEFKAEINEETDTSKIVIYGEIGDYWWDSTSATDIERALKDVTTSVVNVHINSGGGDAFDGIAIRNQLINHPAKVRIIVDGLAASAASIIAMAGDEIVMNTGSMMMIHEASTFAWGTKTDIKKTLNALDGLDKSLADIYMTKFKGEREEIETMITNETWFTADEAVAVGLATATSTVEDDDEPVTNEVNAEQFKANVLARFKKDEPQPNSFLNKFKRSSNE